MSRFQRFRQSCRGDHRRPTDATHHDAWAGKGSKAKTDAPCEHLPLETGAADALESQESDYLLNCVHLGGVLATDPRRDVGRDGEPVTLLLVAFPAPDDGDNAERPETAISEIEVPRQVAEVHSEELRAGRSIFITGQLSGGGGVIATKVRSGLPPPL